MEIKVGHTTSEQKPVKYQELQKFQKGTVTAVFNAAISTLAKENKSDFFDSLTPKVVAKFEKEVKRIAIREDFNYDYSRWLYVKLSKKEFLTMLEDRLKVFRKKKISERQLEFLKSLETELGVGEREFEGDYLEFECLLNELIGYANQLSPATKNQFFVVEDKWLSRYDVFLNGYPDLTTREEIQIHFDIIEDELSRSAAVEYVLNFVKEKAKELARIHKKVVKNEPLTILEGAVYKKYIGYRFITGQKIVLKDEKIRLIGSELFEIHALEEKEREIKLLRYFAGNIYTDLDYPSRVNDVLCAIYESAELIETKYKQQHVFYVNESVFKELEKNYSAEVIEESLATMREAKILSELEEKKIRVKSRIPSVRYFVLRKHYNVFDRKNFWLSEEN